jgi:hypothetical protein
MRGSYRRTECTGTRLYRATPFDRAQLVSGDLVPLKPLTRLLEGLRPEKAAHMIRAEWRVHVSTDARITAVFM